MDDVKIPITSHLIELRARLIRCLIVLSIVFAITWYFSIPLLEFISRPLRNHKLMVISLSEAMYVNLKVAFFAALVFCLPYILYETWKFVAPALYKKEKKYTLIFISSATSLFIMGAAFCLYVMLPFGTQFFLSFKTSPFDVKISADSYLTFVLWFMLIFGIVFQMPLISFFLTKVGLLEKKMLSNNRRYAIVIIFIVAAIFTPPDVGSQILLAIPLLVLYEISIITSRLAQKNKGK